MSLAQDGQQQQQRWALAIHGGAGVINSTHSAWLDDARLGLEASLAAGQAVLEAGGSAIDAVVAAVEQLENDPHFNAGSVPYRAGRVCVLLCSPACRLHVRAELLYSPPGQLNHSLSPSCRFWVRADRQRRP